MADPDPGTRPTPPKPRPGRLADFHVVKFFAGNRVRSVLPARDLPRSIAGRWLVLWRGAAYWYSYPEMRPHCSPPPEHPKQGVRRAARRGDHTPCAQSRAYSGYGRLSGPSRPQSVRDIYVRALAPIGAGRRQAGDDKTAADAADIESNTLPAPRVGLPRVTGGHPPPRADIRDPEPER